MATRKSGNCHIMIHLQGKYGGELYTSDMFLNAEKDLINAHPDPLHPCVLAAFMIWYNSTHLAQFGLAKT